MNRFDRHTGMAVNDEAWSDMATAHDMGPRALAAHAERLDWISSERLALAARGGPVPFMGSRNLRDAPRLHPPADAEPPPEEEEGEWVPPLF